VRDVLIPTHNFLPECVRCTYSLYWGGALCTEFTLVHYGSSKLKQTKKDGLQDFSWITYFILLLPHSNLAWL
jgi:hypothetical protein